MADKSPSGGPAPESGETPRKQRILIVQDETHNVRGLPHLPPFEGLQLVDFGEGRAPGRGV